MPQPISTRYLEPRHDLEGRLLYFLTESTDRRHPPHFVRPEDVPEPEKGAGLFECQRVREGPWMKLKLLRRVEGAVRKPG